MTKLVLSVTRSVTLFLTRYTYSRLATASV